MKLKINISLILLILFTSMTTAQVEFKAKASKKKLGVNERLRIDFIMNKDGDNFNPPDFANFTVVGGPNQSVSNSWVNGVRSFSKKYSYFLAPKKLGNFTIKQATIEIEGKTYKTVPIKITVTKAVDKPKNGNNADYVASENIHLVAEVSKANPYLNAPITVVYKLYVSPNVGVAGNLQIIDKPRYNDFWSQKMESKELKYENGTYNGEDYRYIVIERAVLYPQKTGKLTIDPLTLSLLVEVPTNRRDFFGRVAMTRVNQTVSAKSRAITVKALPETGKPADFSGAVGEFNFKVSTSKKALNATESLQAKVEVTGKGNLKLFQLPKLTLPSSLEVYEPEHSENIRTNYSGMKGGISDSYTIIPQYKGKYPIPSISFSYFDLKTKTYKRLNSEELVIDVIEGPTNTSVSNNNITSANSNKQSVSFNTDQFAFIKTTPNLVNIESTYFFKSNWFWGSILTPFLAIPLAIIIRKKKAKRNADVSGNRIRKADRLAKKYLSEAKKTLGQKEAFYIALEKALHNYLKAKLNIETSDLSKDKIQDLLRKKQVKNNAVIVFLDILKNCELARYTPITNVKMRQDYDKAAQTISTIDKQMR